MPYKQEITPNPNKSCEPGFCLKYVRNTYGIAAKYPSATSAWNNAKAKHADRNYAGIWAPIFFSHRSIKEGHVALVAPDGSVYSASSSTAVKPVYFANLDALLKYHRGSLTYLGWTEDLNAVNVVKWVNPVVNTAVTVIAAINPSTYVVRKGDTLSSIAAKYNTTWQNLQKLNNLPNPNIIYPGQILKVK